MHPLKDIIAVFAGQEFFIIHGRLSAVQLERVLSLLFQGRIEAEKMPVTGGHRFGFFMLGASHAGADAMADAGGIGNNEGRAGISLSHRLQGYTVIAIVNIHGSQVFFLFGFAS